MRPAPFAAGFQFCRPGKVSRVANPASSADPSRDMLSAMPLAVTHFTNSRREGCMLLPHGQRCHGRFDKSAMDACPGPGVTNVGHCVEPNGTAGGENGVIPRLALSAILAARACPPIH